MQICPTPLSRKANASATDPTMMIRDAPLASAKHIDDGDRTLGLPSAFEQAADRDLHCRLLMAWP
jgi:hypothetical protein